MICVHGRVAETCHSCYPDLLVPEQVAVPIQAKGQVTGGAVCVHGNPAAVCVGCAPTVLPPPPIV